MCLPCCRVFQLKPVLYRKFVKSGGLRRRRSRRGSRYLLLVSLRQLVEEKSGLRTCLMGVVDFVVTFVSYLLVKFGALVITIC